MNYKTEELLAEVNRMLHCGNVVAFDFGLGMVGIQDQREWTTPLFIMKRGTNIYSWGKNPDAEATWPDGNKEELRLILNYICQ